MNYLNSKLAAAVLVSAGALVLASCSSDKPAEPEATATRQGTRTTTYEQGEAGGTIEDVFNASATVTDIDRTNRKVSLTASDGTKTVFTAGPQIRNLDQLKVGDKVNATFTERMIIYVGYAGQDPSYTHSSELSRAPQGAKPGAMVAETYEIVAKVKSIDTAKRIAVLQFIDGQTRSVQVRPDVDLSRYKVGDSVVIRVTSALSVLVQSPS